MNLPDSFKTMSAAVSKKILILVLAATGFFLIQPGSAKATLCSDTYGGAEGMSCQLISNCVNDANAKSVIKNAWEAKKVGGYKDTIAGVQAEDFYLTNVYKQEGAIIETVVELCPKKEVGGLPQEQVCCKSKGAAPPPPPKPGVTQYGWCSQEGTITKIKYCLEFPASENFTDAEINDTGKHAAYQCKTFLVDKSATCEKPNCWDYTRSYVCSKSSGVTCKIKEQCDSCSPPIPECGKTDQASQEKCKEVCESKSTCQWSGAKCAVKSESTGDGAAGTGSDSSKANDGSSFIPKKPDGYAGPLPDCAFDGTCRNVNDVLELMVKWGQRIFGLIGTFALVMFVYGGFVMILSAGNSDKVKQGRDILTAAVIGLVIAFSAYLLIDFVLDALNVSEEFRGVNLDV